MRRSATILSTTLMVLACGPLAAQTIESGDIRLRLLGRVQAQFSTTSVDEAELIQAGRRPATAIPAATFETRRIRLGAELTFREWLTGKLEAELGMARLQMRDAYLNMAFDPRFQFRVGQFKKPFSLLQLTSSSVWPVIERGVRIRGLSDALVVADSVAGGTRLLSNFRGAPLVGEEQDLLEVQGYQAFDLGASLHGDLGAFGYHLGLFNGAGSDRPSETDQLGFAGRVTYALPTELPVQFGAGVSHKNIRLTNTPVILTRDGTAFEVDLEISEFRNTGLHLLAEATTGTNLGVTDDDFRAAQAVLAFFRPLGGRRVDGLEFAARVSYGDPQEDVDGDEAWLFTPGVNVYFSGRNRLMFNWDLFRPTGDRFENESALRAQAQFYF